MPKGPKGQNRPADVIGNAVHVMKVLTGEADDEAPDDDKDETAIKGALEKQPPRKDRHLAS